MPPHATPLLKIMAKRGTKKTPQQLRTRFLANVNSEQEKQQYPIK